LIEDIMYILVYRFICSLGLAACMSVRGYRKGSLSANGAVASAAVGVLHLTSGVTFGVVLICFYLTSSKVLPQ